MNKNFLLAALLLICAALLPTSCAERYADDNMGGAPIEAQFSFSVPTFDEKEALSTRASAPSYREDHVQNLFIAIFDKNSGTYLTHTYIAAGISKVEAGEVCYNHRETFAKGRKLRVYAVANIESASGYRRNGGPENLTSEHLVTLAKQGESAFNTVTMQLRLRGEENIAHAYFGNRDNYYFLMAAAQDVSVTDQNNIKLKRVDAKITFKIRSGGNAKFIPLKWRVVKMPLTSKLFPSDADMIQTGTDFSSPNPMSGASEEAGWEGFENIDRADGVQSFTFYMPENRKTGKKNITAAEYKQITGKDLTMPADLYKMRARQEKQLKAGATENPIYKNGAFTFANDQTTYAQIVGDLEYDREITQNGNTFTQKVRVANAQYTIHMGYVNPEKSVNDWNTLRNGNYTYNVTIAGADEVIAEVIDNNNEAIADKSREQNTAAEGAVTLAYNDLHFDCHYGAGVFKLNKFDLIAKYGTVMNSEGKEELNIKADWYTKTPYSNYEKADGDWVRIYINSGLSSENSRGIGAFPYAFYDANTISARYHIYTVERFFDEFLKHATTSHELGFWATRDEPDRGIKAGDAFFTIFVDEYYYEKYPRDGEKPYPYILYTERDGSTGGATLSAGASWWQNGWRTFVNQPDREYGIYFRRRNEVSSDGYSSINTPDVLVRQSSIIAPYQLERMPLNAIGVGYERHDENRDGFGEVQTYSDGQIGGTNGTGAHNWNEWDGYLGWMYAMGFSGASNCGPGHAYLPNYTYDNAGDPSKWSSATGTVLWHVNTSKLPWMAYVRYITKSRSWGFGAPAFGEGQYVTAARVNGINTKTLAPANPIRTCLTRNRDLRNMVKAGESEMIPDGVINPQELRWYTPSKGEMVALDLYSRGGGLPYRDQIDPYRSYSEHYLTSATQWSYNGYSGFYHPYPVSYIASDFSYYRTASNSNNNAWTSAPPNNYNVRCARTLGSTVDPKKYHEPGAGHKVEENSFNTGNILAYDPAYKTVRRIYMEGNPQGADPINCGVVFDLTKISDRALRTFYVPDGELPPHSIEMEASLPYLAFRVAKQGLQQAGIAANGVKRRDAYNSPQNYCGQYSEESGATDRGRWRIPNASELTLMMIYIPYGQTRDGWRNDGYKNGWINGWDSNYNNNLESMRNGSFEMSYYLSSTVGTDSSQDPANDHIFFYYGRDSRVYSNGVVRASNTSMNGMWVSPELLFDIRCVRDITSSELKSPAYNTKPYDE